MKNILSLLAIISSGLIFTGCSSSGKNSDLQALADLKYNVTPSKRQPAGVTYGTLAIGTNQMNGQPEHISSVSITVDNVILPIGSPPNTLNNDVNGSISFPANFDSDLNAKMILAVNNQVPSGHKVSAGMSLTLILGDGSTYSFGRTTGSTTDSPSGFGYSEPLALNPGVSLSSSISAGQVTPTYFRNTLNFCMEQDVRQITMTTTLLIDGQALKKTTQSVQNVGSEKLAPNMCH